MGPDGIYCYVFLNILNNGIDGDILNTGSHYCDCKIWLDYKNYLYYISLEYTFDIPLTKAFKRILDILLDIFLTISGKPSLLNPFITISVTILYRNFKTPL